MISESVLSRSNCDIDISEPFFIFEINNVFPRSVYGDLDKQFPDPGYFPKTHVERGKKRYLDSKMPQFFDFIDAAPSWASLYRYFCAPSVIARLCALVRTVASERSRSQMREWRLVIDPRKTGPISRKDKIFTRLHGRMARFTPVRIGFELSHLEGGCYIPPHTDIAKKLLSLLIYFPDAGVDYGDSGGTEFYRGRGGTPAWSGWKAGMMADDDAARFYGAHETFYTSPFEPNKLVGFVKSSNSWHGVGQLNLAPGVARRSLNINYFTV